MPANHPMHAWLAFAIPPDSYPCVTLQADGLSRGDEEEGEGDGMEDDEMDGEEGYGEDGGRSLREGVPSIQGEPKRAGISERCGRGS